MISRRTFSWGAGLWLSQAARAGAQVRPATVEPWAAKLIAAAERQIGVTLFYDPVYTPIAYPGGDVPLARGVCTDVVIRAYRAGLGVDLQKLVHDDMLRHFSAYPARWGLTRPDANIDHRRVPNLQVFFRRAGASQPASTTAADFHPGDLVTVTLPGNLPHIMLVSQQMAGDGQRPLCIHNIGGGTQREDVLFTYPHSGHYRFKPEA
jgi:uncharacterized protein YijF (DUF1287 family)